MRVLARFMSSAEQQIPFLLEKARIIRDYSPHS